ncbi:MAG: manganese efflux pump MntP family protein [Defluviitaleaceae bacterium]|nr:manganese efflux pump MntP family protein [Defluviitaleaceae bacterium]
MNPIELFALAIGLSADAFAVAVSIGLTMARTGLKKALIVGAYFGFFQGIMPFVGYFAATHFAEHVTAYAHWISFALLLILGGKMIAGGIKKEKCADRVCPAEKSCTDRTCPNAVKEASLSPKNMIPLALATSIDAMAVGVSFAFLYVDVVPAVGMIGAVTFIVSAAGVRVGSIFGGRFKKHSMIAGGVILILIGISIVLY